MNESEYWLKLSEVIRADKELAEISKKNRAGTATFEEIQKYQYRSAQIEAEFLSKHLSEPGNGENSERCYELMQRRYQKVNQDLAEFQEKLDQQAGVKIKAQKAKFPAERARQIANSLEDQTVPIETIQRRAQSAVANIGNSFCDDYVQENAKFRSNAGIKCYITRTTTGKCCAWCTQIAGRYEYGRHPADIFRRHDNCDCTVTYEEGKKRQNVWTKKTWSAPDIPAEALNFKPTVFTPEQARAIERQNLQYKGLTIPGKTDTIKTGGKITDKNFMNAEKFEAQAEKFYESRIKNGDEDVKLIAKHTGFNYEDIQAIKNHVMVEEHLFADGTVRKFDANIDQALAWQRLMEDEGKDSDILLLNHELRELRYMQETGCDYETAHNYSCQKYDWQSVIDDIVDTDSLKSYLMK